MVTLFQCFSGKNTAVGCHFLLQGIFPIQSSNRHLLHWQADSSPLEPPGKLHPWGVKSQFLLTQPCLPAALYLLLVLSGTLQVHNSIIVSLFPASMRLHLYFSCQTPPPPSDSSPIMFLQNLLTNGWQYSTYSSHPISNTLPFTCPLCPMLRFSEFLLYFSSSFRMWIPKEGGSPLFILPNA